MSRTPTKTADEYPRKRTGQPSLRRVYNQDSSLVAKIEQLAAEHGINPRFVDFPSVMTVQTNSEGEAYVEDLNNVVRYYLDSGQLQPTEEFTEHVAVVNQNQHSATTLERMVER